MSDLPSVLVIANAAAGSAADDDVDRVLAVLGEHAQTEVVIPDGDEEMSQALGSADGRDVVVMGGDGSLNWVLSTCVADDLFDGIASIGLVPMGTGNDFARGMGLPLDLSEAARVAVQGERQDCDLLVDEDQNVVMNAVHAGIAAAATGNAESLKGALGIGGYAVGALKAGMSTKGWEVAVWVDGREVLDEDHDALMVTIAVGGSVGGGTPVAPDASHSDRKADVMIATALGSWDRLTFASDLRRGRHVERDDVQVVQGTEVKIASVDPDRTFVINADGDLGQQYRERTWTLRPRAWVCRVPGSSS
ncbi:MAG: diacylglycerol kinase family protein [Ornithinimicrobium sp.]